jgi:hypothetical protein
MRSSKIKSMYIDIMSRIHRATHDIRGHTLLFNPHNLNDKNIKIAHIGAEDLNIQFQHIQLNKFWRFKIENEKLSIQKFNDTSEIYETKFSLE